MKLTAIMLLTSSLAICGCSSERQADMTIAEDGQPARTIRIIVEGKDDVIIEDPYIAEIEALSAEYMQERERVMKERDTMSREERKAFSELQKTSGARIRELQRLRKTYLIAQMKAHDGTAYQAQSQGTDEALKGLSGYLNGLQETK